MRISVAALVKRRALLSVILLSLCVVVVPPLAIPQQAWAASSVSDSFQRANGSLGPNWTAMSDGGLSISSGQAVGAASGDAGDLWTADSFTSDQYSQVTMTATQLTATQWLGTVVRGQNSGLSGYVAIYFWNNGSPEVMLFLRKNGGWAQLGSSYATAPLKAGTVLGLSAAGSSLSVTVNGTAVISATDATLTGGAPGLMTNGSARAAAWAGGSGSGSGSGLGSGSGSGGSAAYSVGGTVSGLSGTVVLQDNGGDNLSVPANGSFTFATQLAAGAAYAVTVATNPAGQTCTVANGSGTVGSGNVTGVVVSCAASTSGPSSVSDSFQRANGSLGPNWTDISDGGLTILSDQATGAASGNSGDLWTAGSFTSDQFSQVQLTSTQLTATQWLGMVVRGQNSGLSGYVAIYFWNNGSPEVMLFLRKNGGWAQLGSSYATAPLKAGTVLGLSAAGSSLSVTVNGTAVISATDATLTGGAPGLMTNGSARAAAWAGGSGSGSGSGLGSGSGSGGSAAYSVGGTVSGLSGTVVLQDNGGDNLSVPANGSFTFATQLAAGAAYAVTVATNPAGQTCTVANGSGTVGSGNVTGVAVSCAASTSGPSSVSDSFQRANGSLGPNWTDISDGGLTILSDQATGAASGNSGDLWTAGSFTSDQFSQVQLTSTQLTATQWLGMVVRGQNSGLSGYVAIYFWNNGSPEVMLFLRKNGGWAQLGSSYATAPLKAGTVLGLSAAGSSLSVTVNGTAVISATDATLTGGAPGLMTNGSARAAAWAGGSGSGSGSGLGSGSGSGGSAAYSVGGTVSGLSGTVVLQDNGGDNLSVPANGSFTFATQLAAGAAYAVTVATNPAGQTCTVANGSGTVGSGNVTGVAVSCAASTSGPSSVSDSFQRANGSLGPNWTDISDGGLTILSDQATGAASGNSGDMWTAGSFTSDQFSQVQLTSTQLRHAVAWHGGAGAELGPERLCGDLFLEQREPGGDAVPAEERRMGAAGQFLCHGPAEGGVGARAVGGGQQPVGDGERDRGDLGD